MRGYFAIGAEGMSKQLNLSTLVRSAYAFEASFVFTVNAHSKALRKGTDSSKALTHLPVYNWASVEDMQLPDSCKLVGVEFIDEAIDLPSFCHPVNAAYVLGPEKGILSEEMLAKCDHIIKIPTRFCINVSVAGSIIMYDRIRSLGRFSPKPLSEINKITKLEDHVHGKHENYATRKTN